MVARGIVNFIRLWSFDFVVLARLQRPNCFEKSVNFSLSLSLSLFLSFLFLYLSREHLSSASQSISRENQKGKPIPQRPTDRTTENRRRRWGPSAAEAEAVAVATSQKELRRRELERRFRCREESIDFFIGERERAEAPISARAIRSRKHRAPRLEISRIADVWLRVHYQATSNNRSNANGREKASDGRWWWWKGVREKLISMHCARERDVKEKKSGRATKKIRDDTPLLSTFSSSTYDRDRRARESYSLLQPFFKVIKPGIKSLPRAPIRRTSRSHRRVSY